MAGCSSALSSCLLHPSHSSSCPSFNFEASVPNLVTPHSWSSTSRLISSIASTALFSHKLRLSKLSSQSSSLKSGRSISCTAALEALVFDCDGVILESEDLHRLAYNATFSHFDVRCPDSESPLDWNTEFYDELQNRIGGGKPKMRWYFNLHGWPSSTIFPDSPQTDEEKAILIDTLQDWKTEKYKDIIASGAVAPRPGVLHLMDEARGLGIKLAVCSAATKSSVIFCLTNLLGKERFSQLDCFIAGDDVDKKKPDPSIYRLAAEVRLSEP
ncbi:hypothetical protein O6H91_Y248400 [Diphasiastrum complanatum]|nr:hypothetical protein O6H91_Y248400 [Diphasiastrum complanatum]